VTIEQDFGTVRAGFYAVAGERPRREVVSAGLAALAALSRIEEELKQAWACAAPQLAERNDALRAELAAARTALRLSLDADRPGPDHKAQRDALKVALENIRKHHPVDDYVQQTADQALGEVEK